MRGTRADVPLTIACLFILGHPAQSEADDGPADSQLGTVVVPGSQPPQEEQRAPSAFSTSVSRADQQDQLTSTASLIAESPGTTLHTYGGPGQLSTLSLRGSSSQEVLVLLDGLPITDAATGGVDLSTLPLGFVDRVEVVRGALGSVYGPGAMGGVVNLVTRRPADAQPEVRGDLQGGSFETFQAGVSGSLPTRTGTVTATATGLTTQGDFGYQQPFTGQDLVRTNDDAEQVGAMVRYSGRLLDGDFDAMADAEQLVRGLAGTVEDPDPSERLSEGRQIGSVRWRHDAVGGSLQGLAFFRHESTDVWGDIGDPGLQQDTAAGAEGLGQWRLGSHAVVARLSAGGDSVTTEARSAGRGDLALAGSDEWLLAGGRVSLIPALRGDLVGSFSALSPSIGAAYRPVTWCEIKATVGRSFRAPTLDELYVNQGLTAPNPQLVPETGSSADIGASFQWRGLAASADGFAALYQNLIIYELYPPLQAKPFNVGTSGIAGAEVEVSGSITPRLRARASYTYMMTRDLYDVAAFYLHELPYHPRNSGEARITWSPLDWVSAFTAIDAQSSQFLNRSSTTSLPGRAFVDAGLAVRPRTSQDLWVGIDIKNVLDERSEDLYGYPLPGRAAYLTVRFDARADGKEPYL